MSTVAIRSRGALRARRRLFLVLAVVLCALCVVPASPARAADPFEAMARRNPVLKKSLAAYLEARQAIWTDFQQPLPSLTDKSVSDISDEVESERATRYESAFEPIETALDQLTSAVHGAAVADKKALLEAYAGWSDVELQDIANAKEIGSRITFTMGTMMLTHRDLWVWYEKQEPIVAALKGLAKAMGEAYRDAEAILAIEQDPAVMKTQAALFRTFTYHAKTLEESLDFYQDACKQLMKEQSPGEKYKGKLETGARLIREAKFHSTGWAKSLRHALSVADEWLEGIEQSDKNNRISMKIYIGETILTKQGKPFDKLKFDEIKDAFGAMYGRLMARAM